MADELIERISEDRAHWLLDAIAGATQDRRFLRGDPEYDAVIGEAILLNAKKAIEVAITRIEPEAADGGVSEAVAEIAAERQRQIEGEGWTPKHDDKHANGALAKAAACYALGSPRVKLLHVDGRARGEEWGREWRSVWPWDEQWWKAAPNRRRQLVKAGALIVAEIERLDRAAIQSLRSEQEGGQ